MDIREKCQPHLWLLTGTVEGHIFAKSLLKEGWKITVSVVSDRATIPYEKLDIEKIFIGALNSEEEIRGVIINARNNKNGFFCVVDLTHPFATKITSTVSKVCRDIGQYYIRYERPVDKIQNEFLIKKLSDLGDYNLRDKSILLALGSRHLGDVHVCLRDLGANVFARVLANPESLKKTLSSSILRKNIAVLNPSNSRNCGIEKALIKKWNIDGVVCRQSGGRSEKSWRQICLSMGIDLWLLKRPSAIKVIDTVNSYENLIKRLKTIRI